MRTADSIQYISFDIFDTLIKRSVARPKDIFLIMEKCSGRRDIPDNFAEKRVAAAESANARYARPTTIREIYAELEAEYGEIVYEWMKSEIDIEIRGCHPNLPCTELFDKFLASKKKIILISDMYLPLDVLMLMLEKCNIRGYDKIYVSCENGARKRDGTLFKKVLSELEILPQQLLHIGDNMRADVIIPLAMGIRVKPVANRQKMLCKKPKKLPLESEFAFRTLNAVVQNCGYPLTSAERQGCSIFGPLLYGFVRWLAARLQEDEINDVYFMSRDGYMMKKAFDALNLEGFQTHYLYCSRRAYTVPMYGKHSEFEDTLEYFKHLERMTLREYLIRLGLIPEVYIQKAEKFGLNMDYVFEKRSFFSSCKVQKFYCSIRNDVIENALVEYNSLAEYIRSLHMANKIAVVDIGYVGTMQHALEQVISECSLDVSVSGYYFWLSDRARTDTLRMSGYLNTIPGGKEYIEKLGRFIPIMEAQFLAPHGSVKRFVMNDGLPQPELCDFEYSSGDDSYSYEYFFISDYQNGAMQFVKYMADKFLSDPLSGNINATLFNLCKVGLSPTLAEARFWGDFHRLSMVLRFLAKPKSLLSYLVCPQQLAKDFVVCTWKIGFMKRLLKLPLPYDRIYDSLKKRYKRCKDLN